MMDSLTLETGVDIPFMSGGVSIHQPSIKEIGYIGQENFFVGCQLLDFSKDMLESEDKSVLENVNNFDILLTLMNDKNPELKEKRISVFMVLALIFPQYRVIVESNKISLKAPDDDEEIGFLNGDNFEEFKNILLTMFCFRDVSGAEEYNPAGDAARAIMEKFKKRKQVLSKQNNTDTNATALFAKYASILSVGLQKDIRQLYEYTVFQLLEEYQRYILKMQSDIHLQAQMAGAKDLKEVEDWMKDLHVKDKDDLLSNTK